MVVKNLMIMTVMMLFMLRVATAQGEIFDINNNDDDGDGDDHGDDQAAIEYKW